MDVRALVFDVYGTLLDVRSIEDACAAVTPNPAELVGLWRQKQLEYSWLRALMARYEDFWTVSAQALDYAAGRLGVTFDDPARERLLQAWLTVRPYQEVPRALSRLATRTLAVLSNGSPRMLEEALRAAGIRERFRLVLSVDEVRTYKPAPAVYALAEARLGLEREQILFVSSNGWDAAGARSFGLPVAWVNRVGRPLEQLGVAPDLIVDDLQELADRVADATFL